MTDLVITDSARPELIRPIASPKELMRLHDDVTRIVQENLRDGIDYGIIPGTDKPTLFKPGSEKLCLAFGLVPEFEVIESDVDHDREVHWSKRKKKWGRNKGEFTWETEAGTAIGLYRYVIRAKLIRDGRLIGQGIGSCSSLESKYVDRPRDCENTILKMAKKRAQVDAVLTTFGLSNRFTQDVEDIKANQRAAANERGNPFDAKNPHHLAALEKKLETRSDIPKSEYNDIAQVMDGHYADELDAMIELYRGGRI